VIGVEDLPFGGRLHSEPIPDDAAVEVLVGDVVSIGQDDSVALAVALAP
jgi:hypothetical protein